MSEADAVAKGIVTYDDVVASLMRGGVDDDEVVVVHTRLSAMGWVVGGAQTIVEALRAVIPHGTLVMPTFSSHLSDPSGWTNPSVPRNWWATVRATMPAYDPATTPTREMGAVVECFRRVPGTLRSAHPAVSLAARGPRAQEIVGHHPLDDGLGPNGPLGRLYDAGASVLLLGVGHGNNSSIHLAEYLCRHAEAQRYRAGAPIRVDGERRWVTYDDVDNDPADFERIGLAFERHSPVTTVALGATHLKRMSQPDLVDFAKGWMDRHRTTER